MNVDAFREAINKLGDEFDHRPLYIAVHGGIGPSAVVNVTGVFSGFDWDSGRVFINTDERLVRFGSVDELIARDRRKRPLTRDYDDVGPIKHDHRPRCVACGGSLQLDFRFCPHCGQRLEI